MGFKNLLELDELLRKKMKFVTEVADKGDLSPLQQQIFQNYVVSHNSKVSDTHETNVIKFMQPTVLKALEKY